MSNFKVDDIVRIKRGSRYYTGDKYSYNPMDVTGVVYQVLDRCNPPIVRVNWSNGNNNNYRSYDLVHYSESPLTSQPKEIIL